MAVKKITMTFTEEVLDLITESAKEKNMSRSGYVAYALQEVDKQKKAMESITTLIELMKEKQTPKTEG